MKEIKEIVLKDEEKQNKNGYQIIIKNLDDNEEVVNVKIRAFIGAYATEFRVGDTLSCQGICLTSCDTATLLATVTSAEKVTENTKNKMFKEILLKTLLERKL